MASKISFKNTFADQPSDLSKGNNLAVQLTTISNAKGYMSSKPYKLKIIYTCDKWVNTQAQYKTVTTTKEFNHSSTTKIEDTYNLNVIDFGPDYSYLKVSVQTIQYDVDGNIIADSTTINRMNLPSWCKPYDCGTTITPVGTSTTQGYLKGVSKVKIDFSCYSAPCARVKKVHYYCEQAGINITSTYSDTPALNEKNAISFSKTVQSSNAVKVAGTYPITITITDSRGAETIIKPTIEIKDYSTPVVSVDSVLRTDSTGAVMAAGKYIKVSSTLAVYQGATGKYSISVRKRDQESWTSLKTGIGIDTNPIVVGGSLDGVSDYFVQVALTDGISTSTAVGYVGNLSFLFDSNAKGTSLGLGVEAPDDENGILRVAYNLRGERAIYTGGKKFHNDGRKGTYIGSDGTIHLCNEGANRPGIWFHYNLATENYRAIWAPNATDLTTDAGAFIFRGNAFANGNIATGAAKTAYNDGKSGVYLGKTGIIMATTDGGTEYPGIRFQYGNVTSDYPSITSKSSKGLVYDCQGVHRFIGSDVRVNDSFVTNGANKTGSLDGKQGCYLSSNGSLYCTGANGSYTYFMPDGTTSSSNTYIGSDTSGVLDVKGSSSIRLNSETVNIDANNVYLGYNDSKEKNLHFQGTQTGASHKCKIYGGNQSSTTALGVYDGHLGITVAAYADGYNSSGSQTGQPSLTINSSVNFKATGTVSSSDERLKEDIKDLDDRYSVLFDNLKFKTFKYKTGNRKWTGVIAQELKEAMDIAGIPSEEFAGYVEYNLDPEEDKEIWNGYADEKGVRYEQLISVIGRELQLEKAKNKALEERVAKLEELINQSLNKEV